MNLRDLFDKSKTSSKFISVELCTNREFDINKLCALSLPFCSVTWHDGNVSNLHLHPSMLVSQKLIDNGCNVLLHLPGRCLNRADALEVLNYAKHIGIKNIFAMQGETSLFNEASDFPHAVNLVRFIKENFGAYFSICVTGYPAGHPKSESLESDLKFLKEKVDAGADFIITQAVFDATSILRFYKNCRDMEIDVPILPGVYVINSYSSLTKMVKFCKLYVPDEMLAFVRENKDNTNIVEKYGIRKTTELLDELLFNREILIPGIHIFSLNDLSTVGIVLAILSGDNFQLDINKEIMNK